MKSYVLPSFSGEFRQLSSAVQATVRQGFKRFENDPGHPGLRFKLIKRDVWSVRIGIGYRALGLRTSPNAIIWFWIGNRADYRRIIRTI